MNHENDKNMISMAKIGSKSFAFHSKPACPNVLMKDN